MQVVWVCSSDDASYADGGGRSGPDPPGDDESSLSSDLFVLGGGGPPRPPAVPPPNRPPAEPVAQPTELGSVGCASGARRDRRAPFPKYALSSMYVKESYVKISHLISAVFVDDMGARGPAAATMAGDPLVAFGHGSIRRTFQILTPRLSTSRSGLSTKHVVLPGKSLRSSLTIICGSKQKMVVEGLGSHLSTNVDDLNVVSSLEELGTFSPLVGIRVWSF